jgi:MFS family permease
MLVAERLGALEERDFRLLWLGQSTSAFGSGLVPVALALAVIELTASEAALGLVLAAGLVSQIYFLLLGGVVADRSPRQRDAGLRRGARRHAGARRVRPSCPSRPASWSARTGRR